EFIVSATASSEEPKVVATVGENFMEQMLIFAKQGAPFGENTPKDSKEELKKEPASEANKGFNFVIEEDLTKEIFGPNEKLGESPREELNEKLNEKSKEIEEKEKKIVEKEKKIRELESQLEQTQINSVPPQKDAFINPIVQAFYDELLLHGVLPEIAKFLLEGSKNETDISEISATVYSKIVNILRRPTPIGNDSHETKFIFFFGPTGVGKTTTIAKIASKLVLEENENIGLITADTYRIAAAEQLKIYADILSVDIDVIGDPSEFLASATNFRNRRKKFVLVDSAGRSHKKSENLNELVEIFNTPFANEKFLVLSATTKYEDLEDIVQQFLRVGNFRLVLTKFDETLNYGNVLNLCFNLNVEVVYITMGQNVPYDIEVLQPQKIAKALLGLEVYR
ncbi:MAG: AAA family ATPase, partial [Defluviitaleaceae bacterium]|nr:AAA family ATPase [Defluviitaleaceae bacterium]